MAIRIGTTGDAGLTLLLSGSTWDDGLTAQLTITNTGATPLANWSLSFESDVWISGSPWGLSVTDNRLANGRHSYTLTGLDWGASLAAGGSVTVGFNASRAAGGASGGLQASALFISSPMLRAVSSATTVSARLPDSNPPTSVPPPLTTAAPPTAPTASMEVNASSYPVKGGGVNYAEALQKSFLFYEGQRSGNLDEATKRIDWRGDSGLRDGKDGVYFGNNISANLQAGLTLDLTGGYHDAGDCVKFGLPLASTLATLAWGGLQFAQGYATSGQTDELLAAVKWGTDYLLKCHGRDASGKTTFFVAQVGDAAADHSLWQPPETETIARPALAITPSRPGSDVAGGSAAALAAASLLFRRNGDGAYADQLLSSAVALYTFAETYRGKYSDSISVVEPYYKSWSGYNDELAYGAAWLALAVQAQGSDRSSYLNKALTLYTSAIGGLNKGWTGNWDDSSYATAILLAQQTGSPVIKSHVEGWLNNWVTGGNGVQITAGGLRWISQWGSLRYAANTAFLADVYASAVNDPNGAYTALARQTVDYILGANPRQSSYLVGYGQNFPQQPHSRAPSGVGWAGFNNGLPNVHINFGALVGGPSQPNDTAYVDLRSDYICNEVALDYNAGLSGAFAANVERNGGVALSDAELDALPGITIHAPTPTPTPVNQGAASFVINGTAAVGQTLVASQTATDPEGVGPAGFTYQWQASSDGGQTWGALGGTAPSLALTTAEEGKAIRLKVTYSDGANAAETVVTPARGVPFVNDGQAEFALVGSGVVGETLSVRQTRADPDGEGALAAQWQVQASGGAWKPIPGANALSFVPLSAQQGQSLRLQLSYRDRQGFAETVTSNTVQVPVPPSPPSPSPDQPILDPGGAIQPAVPLTSAPALKLSVGGSLWYQGLTAQITLTNTGAKALNSWSVSFPTTHALSGVAWGASLSQVSLGGGLLRSTLTGKDWGGSLAAGASVTVGFNASQGLKLGDTGSLTGPGLFASSALQLAAAGGNPTYQTGDGAANVLKAGASADLLTGLGGSDVFQLSRLNQSLLGAMDRLTDFSVGVDRLDGPTAVAASRVARLGAVTTLKASDVASLLTAQRLLAHQAATFTLGSGPTTRSFIALNDGVAGFQAASDAVVELTGYSGDLRGLGVV
ncbi:MAG: glycoside hydrolase family 9 protein [Cyanobacteriota bacterium]|nr:glycoside hydrolase family 9 protein [Cyanobacteriota bacterium]